MRKRLFKPEQLPWRTGRKVHRTVYAQLDDTPTDHDPLIGMFDTGALAEAAVQAHNAALTFTRTLTTPAPTPEHTEVPPA